LRAYARRLGDLGRARAADVLWLEKEALPWVPPALESALLPRRVPLVTDYDDAVFHRYDLHRRAAVRRLLGRKIDRVMAASDLVMAGNAYLADRARAAGAPRVEIVPTVVEAARYAAPATPVDRNGAPVIGWIGSPSTWREYMVPMLPMLTDVARRSGARLRVVGSGARPDLDPLVDVLPWTEADEVARIHEMDIGIMPLDDSPWARGKCGYKLIQYMAAGLPVIASPVGVNAEIVEHGVNGLLARDADEWRDALATLLADPALRARMGAAGRRRVEERYSAEVWGPRIAELLHEVAARGRPGARGASPRAAAHKGATPDT
ncbi:MAG: glycosyltransferase, partial [Alphaproteobacteria bacterium]